MRKPEQIIGHDAFVQLTFEGYAVVPFKMTDDQLSAALWAAVPEDRENEDAMRKAYNAALNEFTRGETSQDG